MQVTAITCLTHFLLAPQFITFAQTTGISSFLRKMAEEVSLLDMWASPFGMRVRIALAEKGIKYERKEENLQKKSPLLLQANPIHQKVPVLIHNGFSICESLIILEYIDEVWEDSAPLLPTDPYRRAMARFWADYVDDKIYPCGRRICISKGEEQEEAKKEFIGILKVLEGELGEKSYFGGERLGFVDIAILPFYTWFYSFETIGNFSIEAEVPKLVAWEKRCLMIESVSKSLPDPKKVYEFILDHKKRWG